MITEYQIGEFKFIAQTTYYMYINGNNTPILITSDKKIFSKQKQLAKKGKIKPKTKLIS